MSAATATDTTETNESQSAKDAARVQQLVDGGMAHSDALKKVANERGVKVSTIRGAVYRAGGPRTNGSSGSMGRKKTKTTDDYIEQARASLQAALDQIEGELEAARERADEAAREYAHLKGTMAERRKSLEAKIKALA